MEYREGIMSHSSVGERTRWTVLLIALLDPIKEISAQILAS